MTIALEGTICTNADTAADFTTNNGGANISGDDDLVEGTGAVGDKMSNTTELLVSDNLTFTTSTVYDFSSAGATSDEGAHFIGWCNTKTPINATTGIAIMFRNASGHQGAWDVPPAYFYKGGFTTRVINPSADFDRVTTWSLTGNPAQLDDVTEMGFEFTTITSIMGSFNNTQVDQMVVGFGVRADVGTAIAPNTYQDVVDQDQDTSFWGWHSSIGAKGGLYIGPATGTTASWFVDENFLIKFLDENVAAGFYGLFIRGANTTCTFTLANILAENPTNARWSLILDSAMGDTTGGFSDTQGAYTGSDAITLNANATLTNTSLIDGNSLTQNGATLDGIVVVEPNVTASTAYIDADDIGLISNSTFNANGSNVGHAIEITDATGSPFDFDDNTFPGFTTSGAGSNLVENSGPTNAMIWNSSLSAVTINIGGSGQNVTVRNSGTGSTTTVVAGAVVTSVHCIDGENPPNDLQNVRVLVKASDNTQLPFEETVTIVNSGTTATVTHTGHGMVAGDLIEISQSASEFLNRGVQTIATVTDANTYTYTMAGTPGGSPTGTITSTFVIISGLTDVNGDISATRTFGADQPIIGRARMATTPPFYQTGNTSGTISSTGGFSTTIQMILDQ